MRAILVTIRYPDRRAINAQDCRTAPTMGVNLLTSMTCHNGIEQVFEWGDPQSVAGLYQARRTDGRLADVIRKNQMQMVAYGLNRPVTQEGHAKHQPDDPFCWELSATNRSGARRFEGLRHQRSVEARGESVEVVERLVAGGGQQCGAKVHPSF
ncbi:hypothetical protein ACVWZX_004507 [Deinococcus sp. UYEF24]